MKLNSTPTLKQMHDDRESVIDWFDDWLSSMEVVIAFQGQDYVSLLGDLPCYSKERLIEEYDSCLRKEFALAYLTEHCGYTCTPPKAIK